MRQRTRQTTLILLCLAMILLPGCVERKLLLRSDPPGAVIDLNGQPAGLTPTDVPFLTYGSFEIVAHAPGYQRLRTTAEVEPPWWQHMPFDFFAESVWPFTLTDTHPIELELEPFSLADEEGLDAREETLRKRLEAGQGE